ncbi:hypothetical protein NC652_009274 [Populus alba x Populus x berolinensis]|nr:hypothetical protein NC652_009274 [Populus alba x Populus x berolinensis]
MCKIPAQDFFANEFGLPLTMIPNLEDMAGFEMVYGQVPPPHLKRIQWLVTNLCVITDKPHLGSVESHVILTLYVSVTSLLKTRYMSTKIQYRTPPSGH